MATIANVDEGERIATEWGNAVADTVNGLSNAVNGLQTTSLPPGSMIDYGGTDLTPGMVGIWLLCDGTIQLRSAYASLFAAIGTNFNTGGETGLQFRLPDLRTRVTVGRHPNDTAFDQVGERGGIPDPIVVSHTHTFTGNSHQHTAPLHSHPINTSTGSTGSVHTHGVSGTTSVDGQHGHNFGHGTQVWWVDPNAWGFKDGVIVDGYAQKAGKATWVHEGNHSHTWSGTTGYGSADHSHAINSSTDNGGNGATTSTVITGQISTDGVTPSLLKNYPPFVVVTKIIKV